MSKIDESTLGRYLNDLMRAKLGALLDWQRPQFTRTVGPFDENGFKEFELGRDYLIENCRARLREMSDSEILILCEAKVEDVCDIRHEWNYFLADEIRLFYHPMWFACGFNHPDYVADFDYWAKMPVFSLREAVCLSIGFDPKHFDEATVKRLVSGDSPQSEMLSFFVRRYEQFRRNFGSANNDLSVEKKNLAIWVRDSNLECHPEFLRIVLDVGPEISLVPELHTGHSPVDSREKASLAKLLVAMAMDAYGYVPEAKRSPIPNEIEDIATRLGLELSNDTIRKYLQLGAKYLPKGD